MTFRLVARSDGGELVQTWSDTRRRWISTPLRRGDLLGALELCSHMLAGLGVAQESHCRRNAGPDALQLSSFAGAKTRSTLGTGEDAARVRVDEPFEPAPPAVSVLISEPEPEEKPAHEPGGDRASYALAAKGRD